MIPKKVHLIRHAQAQHNVNFDNWSFPDALLTQNGEIQCQSLNKRTVENIQSSSKLIVSSPMRRTLQTTLKGLPSLIERLGGRSSIIVLDSLQENGSTPADTGSSRSTLESLEEFRGIDFSSLGDLWNSKTGFWASDHASLHRRAQCTLDWLASRSEDEIVVVSHGGALRYLTEDYRARFPWKNTEVRTYNLVNETNSMGNNRLRLILNPNSTPYQFEDEQEASLDNGAPLINSNNGNSDSTITTPSTTTANSNNNNNENVVHPTNVVSGGSIIQI